MEELYKVFKDNKELIPTNLEVVSVDYTKGLNMLVLSVKGTNDYKVQVLKYPGKEQYLISTTVSSIEDKYVHNYKALLNAICTVIKEVEKYDTNSDNEIVNLDKIVYNYIKSEYNDINGINELDFYSDEFQEIKELLMVYKSLSKVQVKGKIQHILESNKYMTLEELCDYWKDKADIALEQHNESLFKEYYTTYLAYYNQILENERLASEYYWEHEHDNLSKEQFGQLYG